MGGNCSEEGTLTVTGDPKSVSLTEQGGINMNTTQLTDALRSHCLEDDGNTWKSQFDLKISTELAISGLKDDNRDDAAKEFEESASEVKSEEEFSGLLTGYYSIRIYSKGD